MDRMIIYFDWGQKNEDKSVFFAVISHYRSDLNVIHHSSDKVQGVLSRVRFIPTIYAYVYINNVYAFITH